MNDKRLYSLAIPPSSFDCCKLDQLGRHRNRPKDMTWFQLYIMAIIKVFFFFNRSIVVVCVPHVQCPCTEGWVPSLVH